MAMGRYERQKEERFRQMVKSGSLFHMRMREGNGRHAEWGRGLITREEVIKKKAKRGVRKMKKKRKGMREGSVMMKIEGRIEGFQIMMK